MKRLLAAAALAPAGPAAARRGPRRVRDLRLGPQGRDAEPRAGRRWRSRASRRCSTAPATSTARATAAACWSTSRARSGPRRSAPGGHNPSLALDHAFAVAHVFVERSPDLERVLHDAREILGRGGFRILAERLGAVDSAALGPTAREEEPHFWQVAGLLADAASARPRPVRARRSSSRPSSASTSPSFSADHLRLQGDGRAEGARRLLPRPRRRAVRDGRLLRPQPLLDQHLALVQAGAAVLGPRPQRRDQHDRAAAPGGADARRRRSRAAARTPRT